LEIQEILGKYATHFPRQMFPVRQALGGAKTLVTGGSSVFQEAPGPEPKRNLFIEFKP